jgi:curli biogenesis system outer membrane secretion channel CsgG
MKRHEVEMMIGAFLLGIGAIQNKFDDISLNLRVVASRAAASIQQVNKRLR